MPADQSSLETRSNFTSPHGQAPFAGRGGQPLIEVPDHELMRRIGNGAYGEVWLARTVVGTRRAVKMVYRRNFSEAYPFEREFKGIQRYEPVSRSHDGLIDILQIGRNDAAGCFYYVMELADDAAVLPDGFSHAAAPDVRRENGGVLPAPCYVARTLREEVRRRRRLPAVECLAVGLRLTAALEHLHQSGLVHRDIKPSNIVFVDGAPKLADIGLVAEVDEARSFVGTMGFIPPEGPGTPQADVYGLGKVLYELLTGKDRHEFPALPEEFLIQAQERTAQIGLNQVILRACESDPRVRYPSARAMQDDLALLQRGEPLRCRPMLRQWFARGTTAVRTWVGGTAQRDLESALPEANHLFEKGHLCALGATPERLRQASRYFAGAVELDPKFVPAHIGLFRVRLLELTALPDAPAAAVADLRTAAAKLISVAPSTAEARMASSLTHYLEGRIEVALEEIRLAAQMRGCSRQTRAITHALAGSYLLDLGQPAAALEQLKLSEKAVPTCAIGQVGLGHPYFVQGRFDLALAQYQKSIELEPRQWLGHFWSGRTYEELGDFERAIDEFEQADLRTMENEASLSGLSLRPDTASNKCFYDAFRAAFREASATGYWRTRLKKALAASPQNSQYIATVYARLRRMDDAYAWLTKAFHQRNVSGLCFDLCWDRNDPRFQAIAGKR